jgi:hypothetical protein
MTPKALKRKAGRFRVGIKAQPRRRWKLADGRLPKKTLKLDLTKLYGGKDMHSKLNVGDDRPGFGKQGND